MTTPDLTEPTKEITKRLARDGGPFAIFALILLVPIMAAGWLLLQDFRTAVREMPAAVAAAIAKSNADQNAGRDAAVKAVLAGVAETVRPCLERRRP